MWIQIESFMKIPNQFRWRSAFWAALWMLCGVSAFAQDDNTPRSAVVPSPMSIHTWFIIAAFGAFLAWCISYSLQLQKEALKRRTGREGLMLRKNQYVEELAELESQKEAGTISEQRFRRLYINTKLRLAKVIEQIEQIEQKRDTSQDT
jgi:hypothetical protein